MKTKNSLVNEHSEERSVVTECFSYPLAPRLPCGRVSCSWMLDHAVESYFLPRYVHYNYCHARYVDIAALPDTHSRASLAKQMPLTELELSLLWGDGNFVEVEPGISLYSPWYGYEYLFPAHPRTFSQAIQLGLLGWVSRRARAPGCSVTSSLVNEMDRDDSNFFYCGQTIFNEFPTSGWPWDS